MYSVIDLSKYIVTKCVDDGCPISNLQLQKILYSIQIAYLKDGNAIFPELFEAWQFGPVVPESYYYFCGSGGMPITRRFDEVTIDQHDRSICDPIIERKRIIAPWKLVADTHREGGAWKAVYGEGEGNRSVIPNDTIVEHEL